MPFLPDSALDAAPTEQELYDAAVRALVPARADWASVHVLRADSGPQLRAVAHADPYKVNLAWELERRWPPRPDAPTGAPAVCRTGEPQVGTVPDELLATVARDGAHLQVLRALGLRSFCCVPLRAGGELFGALTLVTAESGRMFTQWDVEPAQAAADAVAERAARLRREGLLKLGLG